MVIIIIYLSYSYRLCLFKLGEFIKYEVYRYYSSFVLYEIEADSEEEAYDKTLGLKIDKDELLNNALDWKDADEVYKIEENPR